MHASSSGSMVASGRAGWAFSAFTTSSHRLAFSGSAPNYGFAAAVCVFIFAVTALMILPSFRATRALEEVN